jgi:hypothetical protein
MSHDRREEEEERVNIVGVEKDVEMGLGLYSEKW